VAQIYHIPLSVTNRHMPVPFGPDYNTVLAYADLVSEKRFGVKSLLLSMEQREIILEAVEHMLRELDELRRQGRAS
jgi:hypothetical protein